MDHRDKFHSFYAAWHAVIGDDKRALAIYAHQMNQGIFSSGKGIAVGTELQDIYKHSAERSVILHHNNLFP
ncbi:hypothetical protein SAMN05216230_102298 [Pseudomonas soli]|uniref:Uncharacterized protein n=1 Tax=Pseudomonas soli TaxID=1306993 RepID=A0A1H9EKV6_9PSED|nr:hypothetical protein SAMN05216230_102298 [Pseudomonas soli]